MVELYGGRRYTASITDTNADASFVRIGHRQVVAIEWRLRTFDEPDLAVGRGCGRWLLGVLGHVEQQQLRYRLVAERRRQFT